MKFQVQVDVTKEAYELGLGLKRFVVALKGALKDGWQPGKDIPVVLNAAMTDLMPAVEGLEKLEDEIKADKAAFVSALALPAMALILELLPEEK